MMDIEEWGMEEKEISIKDMDNLVKEYREAREEYDKKKKESTEAYKVCSAIEGKLIQALDHAGKKSYKTESGTFSIVEKKVITTPKTNEEKEKIFNWVKEKYGQDFLTSLVGINHASLNSFYNKEYNNYLDHLEQLREEGVDTSGLVFKIDGISEPTVQRSTSFRKK